MRDSVQQYELDSIETTSASSEISLAGGEF